MWRFVSPFVIQVREADEKEDTVAMPPPQVVLKKGKVLSNLVLVQEIERMEEQKLKSKFPGAPGIFFRCMAQGGWRSLATFSSKIFEQALEGDLDLEVLEVTQPSSRSSILRRITLLCVVSHPWPTFHFLQKRLGKGQKFFDSGDYQMAKQVNFQWFWWSRVHLFLLSVKQSVPLREVQVAWGQGCLSWPNPLAQVSLPEKSKKSPFIQGWLILLRTQFLPGKAPSFRFYQKTWKTTLKESFIISPAGGSWAGAPGFSFSFNFELLSLWFGGGKFVIWRLGPSGLWIDYLRVINPESDFSLLSGRWNSRSASSQPCSGQTTVIQSKKAPPVQKKINNI